MDARRHGRPPTSSPSTRANLTLALRIKERWDDAEPHLDHVMTLTKSFESPCTCVKLTLVCRNTVLLLGLSH
jgi:hypothetical protein